jgi:hypothetical protein
VGAVTNHPSNYRVKLLKFVDAPAAGPDQPTGDKPPLIADDIDGVIAAREAKEAA